MAEAFALVGLIAAIVQFVDTGVEVVHRLNEFQSDAKDLSPALESLQSRLPLIVDTLQRTKKQAEEGHVNEATAQALEPVIRGSLQQVR